MSEKEIGKGHPGMQVAHAPAADINDRLIINLRDLGHMMRFLYEGKASQKRILMILNESERMTQRDLTERLGIQPGSASEILLKLERAGLILRTPNEADRRTTDVCLTDDGRVLAAEALAQRQKRHEEMFSCLLEEERQELLSLLERVSADWRSRYMENKNVHDHGAHQKGVHQKGAHQKGQYGESKYFEGHRRHGGFHEHRGS